MKMMENAEFFPLQFRRRLFLGMMNDKEFFQEVVKQQKKWVRLQLMNKKHQHYSVSFFN